MGEPTSKNKPFNISKRLVWEAYQRVRANKGAPGVDGCSIEDFEADLRNNPPDKVTGMSRKVASWKMHRRTNLTLNDIAKEVNPVLRGWLTYFTVFYPSMVIPLCKRIDRCLMRWARNKYKRLEHSDRRARVWLYGVRERAPRLFAHWELRYRS